MANSRHTFIADEGDEVVAFVSTQGPIAFLGEGDEIVGIEPAHSFPARYEVYCAEHGLEPVDLTAFALR